ncbi:MAG: GerMN domain-containing protein [Ilumatobacteraceae bacterium]|jgi:spore germination protein GerM|nr:GerMN domain-containing protein [Actinomycetota bacterium]MDA3011362.1 GerMN domain-containing protein [Actinomycetota bacterium]MDA3024226.1 GerMN domain-containing protein [Actinomycetota bacterium]
MRNRLPRHLVVGSIVVLSSSCGLGTDGTPRLIADEDQRPLVEVTTELVSSGTGRIYLERTDETGRPLLVAVARQISNDPGNVIEALLSGPTDEEQSSGIGSAIPLGTTLLDARYTATDMIRVDVSADILDSTGDDLVSALAQIVFSLGEVSGVERIDITVDGRAQDWPRGDGSLTADPLTAYDYPGRAASSQPAFPGYVLPSS